jgi:NADPH:quinone reductase-like Zn-dependent oxidoreductase
MAEAATLPISFTTAHHCLITKGGLRQAETVVVQAAAGGVGLAAVQIAHAEGARVIAIAGGATKVDAIAAVLASGRISGLITDERTAGKLVEKAAAGGGKR